jgi:hypothetical protein
MKPYAAPRRASGYGSSQIGSRRRVGAGGSASGSTLRGRRPLSRGAFRQRFVAMR